MEKRNTKKRAFTLAELAVVLAVTAIAATMVVTFTSLVSNRRAEAQARLDALNDIKVAEALIEAWLTDSDNTLTFENDVAKEITYVDGTLRVGDRQHTLDRVTSIKITEYPNGALVGAPIIYFCTVEYTLPGQSEYEYYTFCVNAQKV